VLAEIKIPILFLIHNYQLKSEQTHSPFIHF